MSCTLLSPPDVYAEISSCNAATQGKQKHRLESITGERQKANMLPGVLQKDVHVDVAAATTPTRVAQAFGKELPRSKWLPNIIHDIVPISHMRTASATAVSLPTQTSCHPYDVELGICDSLFRSRYGSDSAARQKATAAANVLSHWQRPPLFETQSAAMATAFEVVVLAAPSSPNGAPSSLEAATSPSTVARTTMSTPSTSLSVRSINIDNTVSATAIRSASSSATGSHTTSIPHASTTLSSTSVPIVVPPTFMPATPWWIMWICLPFICVLALLTIAVYGAATRSSKNGRCQSRSIDIRPVLHNRSSSLPMGHAETRDHVGSRRHSSSVESRGVEHLLGKSPDSGHTPRFHVLRAGGADRVGVASDGLVRNEIREEVHEEIFRVGEQLRYRDRDRVPRSAGCVVEPGDPIEMRDNWHLQHAYGNGHHHFTGAPDNAPELLVSSPSYASGFASPTPLPRAARLTPQNHMHLEVNGSDSHIRNRRLQPPRMNIDTATANRYAPDYHIANPCHQDNTVDIESQTSFPHPQPNIQKARSWLSLPSLSTSSKSRSRNHARSSSVSDMLSSLVNGVADRIVKFTNDEGGVEAELLLPVSREERMMADEYVEGEVDDSESVWI